MGTDQAGNLGEWFGAIGATGVLALAVMQMGRDRLREARLTASNLQTWLTRDPAHDAVKFTVRNAGTDPASAIKLGVELNPRRLSVIQFFARETRLAEVARVGRMRRIYPVSELLHNGESANLVLAVRYDARMVYRLTLFSWSGENVLFAREVSDLRRKRFLSRFSVAWRFARFAAVDEE